MLSRSLFLLLIPVLVGSSQAAIDLTPGITEIVEDTVSYREVSFKTPEGKLRFDLPPGWTIRGQKDRALMTSADRSLDAVIEVTPLQKPEPLDQEAIAKFKQQVVAALPPGSTKVATAYEAENPIIPGGNPSYEFVITYDLWGKVFERSALLVNGPQDRFVFRFTSLKQDFALLNTQFRRTVMTWRAIETKQAPATAIADARVPRPATN
jgi:hypothetical protein